MTYNDDREKSDSLWIDTKIREKINEYYGKNKIFK